MKTMMGNNVEREKKDKEQKQGKERTKKIKEKGLI